MKKIVKLLLQIMLWLSMEFSQAAVISSENLDEMLTIEQVSLAINGLITVLDENYIHKEKALLIEKRLKQKLSYGDFQNISDWYSFIRQVNNVMRRVSGDMFLDLIAKEPLFMLEKVQNKINNPTDFNLYNLKVLKGNIGYLKLNYFYRHSDAKSEISYAFNKLSDVDALIIDLRSVEGESIFFAQYFMSFFVVEGTVLSEILYDKKNKRKLLKAINNNGNDKFKNNFPVYILTSSFLSSSGEFLSYTLKHLKKAVIVGEETMGVAYIIQQHMINNYISLKLPIAIPLHPLTKTNWSKVGVVPDVDISASLSLEAAHEIAMEYLGYSNKKQLSRQ